MDKILRYRETVPLNTALASASRSTMSSICCRLELNPGVSTTVTPGLPLLPATMKILILLPTFELQNYRCFLILLYFILRYFYKLKGLSLAVYNFSFQHGFDLTKIKYLIL
jgi:hypothetical protein